MEHVRKFELDNLVDEMYRVLKPGGVISHNINYKDHLDESLNNLRFSERLWESKLFANSGFYTNRIPALKMHEIFEEIGFKIKRKSFCKWKKLPIKRSNINKEFDIYTDKVLLNRTSYVLLEKS